MHKIASAYARRRKVKRGVSLAPPLSRYPVWDVNVSNGLKEEPVFKTLS